MKTFFLLFLLFFAKNILSQIPLLFGEHIERELEHEISKIGDFSLTEQGKDIYLSRYVDSMSIQYYIKDIIVKDVVDYIKDELNFVFGDIRNDDSNIEHFHFEGISIPIIKSDEIDPDYPDRARYFVPGIRRDSGHPFYGVFDEPCLKFDIENDELVLQYIATGTNACPTPTLKGAGNFLLKAVEAYAIKRGIKKISLIDGALIFSERGEVLVDLAYVYIFKHGKTWYQSFGYFSENGKEKDLAQGQALRNICMERALAVLKSIKSSKSTIEQQGCLLLEKKITEYRQKGKAEVLLGNFFLWLWEEDPETYEKLIYLIFPSFPYDESYFDADNRWFRELHVETHLFKELDIQTED